MCCMCNSRVCDRTHPDHGASVSSFSRSLRVGLRQWLSTALDVTEGWKRSEVEHFDCFLLPQHFCYCKFLTKRCTESETLKLWLLKSSTSNSMKARAWVHQIKPTWWLDNRHWACCTECSFTSLSSLDPRGVDARWRSVVFMCTCSCQ
jgi:hypothetical protein